jgi:hypothetical protein
MAPRWRIRVRANPALCAANVRNLDQDAEKSPDFNHI